MEQDAQRALQHPNRLFDREEALAPGGGAPAAPGIYAWYFLHVPGDVPTAGCYRLDGMPLLYVGIAPRAPSADGTRTSRQTLRDRLKRHFRGDAARSTLRRSLGCLLQDELGLSLRPVASGVKTTFGREGERALSDWIAENGRVCWYETDRPWIIEPRLIALLDLPLNLSANSAHPFRQQLSKLRRAARQMAYSSG